jgi:penicillin G amidase
MYPEWLAYGSDAKRIAQAFTAGINAYVTLTQQQPELLPPEFTLLDYLPATWAPSDVVRIRSNGLWRNVRTEVKRARIACEFDLQTAGLWKVLEPQWETQIPEGLDPCDIPEDVLTLYNLATSAVDLSAAGSAAAGKRNAAAQRDAAGQRNAADATVVADIATDDHIRESLGSNNWVVAPERTDTGRPILANDPHRGHAVPSLRYIAHLSAPGLDVIGAGEPALPGISIGHNEKIAFGLTIFPIDQEDLYVYNRTRGGYRYGGGSEALKTLTETIKVRNAPDETVTLAFTRHGPVIHQTRKRFYALRAAWLEPGMAPYFGSVEYMRAANWREFVSALNRWGAPSENQVYADTDGNIGYKPAGRFPKRVNFDGLLPVPGDGRYEWDGCFDMDALPSEYNPERGFTGTANAMNLPADYPIAEQKVGFEWSAPWRYRRLWEVLSAQQQHGLIDSHDLQRDYQSILAREAIARLPAAAEPGSALAMLKNWNCELDIDSPEAALYAIWFYRQLGPALVAQLAPGAQDLILPLDSYTILTALNDPDNIPAALAALDAAWLEAQELLGDDPQDWRWGSLHQIQFVHPLQEQADGELAEAMRFPAYPRGGSANTTNNTGFSPVDFLVRSGASYRMVLDVGRWDDAEMTNAPGQSGDPRSRFYRDLLQGWAEDSSFPLLYSREAIRANKAFSIELLPKQ